jgi:hypothetical protein
MKEVFVKTSKYVKKMRNIAMVLLMGSVAMNYCNPEEVLVEVIMLGWAGSVAGNAALAKTCSSLAMRYVQRAKLLNTTSKVFRRLAYVSAAPFVSFGLGAAALKLCGDHNAVAKTLLIPAGLALHLPARIMGYSSMRVGFSSSQV